MLSTAKFDDDKYAIRKNAIASEVQHDNDEIFRKPSICDDSLVISSQIRRRKRKISPHYRDANVDLGSNSDTFVENLNGKNYTGKKNKTICSDPEDAENNRRINQFQKLGLSNAQSWNGELEENRMNSHDYLDENLKIRAIFPVVSVYVASQIDIVAVLTKVFDQKSYRFEKSSVIIQLPSSTSISTHGNIRRFQSRRNKKQVTSKACNRKTLASKSPVETSPHDKPHASSSHTLHSRHVVVFRFGSVVFFDVGPREQRQIIEDIKQYSSESVSRGFELKEHFGVAVCPGMEELHSRVNGSFATIKAFSMNNVAVISTIMAQTVALDSYNIMVDKLLGNFANINSTVKQTGNFTTMERESLFKVVAQNNSIFIDMVSKLGLKDRSDTAWNLSQYETVHEAMKDEFEINGRFKQIEFKLNLIQQNAKFFLEILHNQKTNTLEWIIIWLISLECILMCLDMSGMGSTILNALPLPSNFE